MKIHNVFHKGHRIGSWFFEDGEHVWESFDGQHSLGDIDGSSTIKYYEEEFQRRRRKFMITLPKGFTATKFNGYFWDLVTKRVFSIKIDGVLKPLTLSHPNIYNHAHEPFYAVSVKGKKRWLTLSYLKTLTEQNSEIPRRDTSK